MKKEIVEKSTNIPQPYKEMKMIATDLFKSGMFPHLHNPGQAIAIVEYGRELGVPPMQAMQMMAPIKGKIGVEAKLLYGLAQRHGYDIKVIEQTDKICKIEFIPPQGISHKVQFTYDEAVKLGAATKERNGEIEIKDNWKKQPATMLFYRCISKAIRFFAPKVLLEGAPIYTIEELSEGNAITTEDIANQEIEVQNVSPTPKKEDVDWAKIGKLFTQGEIVYIKNHPESMDKTLKEMQHRQNLKFHWNYLMPRVVRKVREIRKGKLFYWDKFKKDILDNKEFRELSVDKQLEEIEIWKLK